MIDDGKPAVEQFEDDLIDLVSRYAKAGRLTLAETVGTMQIVSAKVLVLYLDQECE